jgi:hypothetical protein
LNCRVLLFAVPLLSLLACGPAPRPPASQPIAGPPPPAATPASQPTTGPVPWITERCRGASPRLASMPPATQPSAPPLEAEEAAALRERGLLLEPARLRHFVVARGGRIELHRKPTPNGNGKGKGKGGKPGNGAPPAPRPGVVCVPIAEADLLPLPGCERLHLCAEEGAYALVVESGGRPALARGATVSLAGFGVRVMPAPEAGEQIVWQASERGLDATHLIEREEILRPKGLGLRHVFGRVVASSLHEEPAAKAGPATRPAGCRYEPLQVRCGDERFAWDADAFEYRLAVPAGLVPYKPHEVATGASDPVRALYAALHAAAAASVGFQRRGFECVEAQTSYELWSRWPVREGKPTGPGEVWRVAVAPGRVTVEILPFVPEDDGLAGVRGVKADHAYARERAFLAAFKEALARNVDGPPKGLEGFRCGAGFGQPIADVSLGAGLEKVRTREQRWRRKCDKTLAQAKKAAAAAGGRVRLTCEGRDKITRTYEFAADSLVGATERYPADFAPRHLSRATERWTARFGSPSAATDASSRWRWRDRELSATRLPDGAALFEHRLAPAPASQPAPARVVPACRAKEDCPYSQACVGGRCGPCRDHRDCRADSRCRDGRCVQGPM